MALTLLAIYKAAPPAFVNESVGKKVIAFYIYIRKRFLA